MKNLIGFIGGVIFSIGLVVSGMVNPSKVIGFLDIFRQWDYSLAFVMGGAVLVNLILFKVILTKKPILNECHTLPMNSLVDKRLIIGSAIFGIGWGLLGVCPGPGLVNLVTLDPQAFLFVFSMLIGMFTFKLLNKKT